MTMVLVGCFMALFSVCSLRTLAAQDLSSFMERAENLVGSKVPGWKLTEKELNEKEAKYQWGHARQGIRMLIYYATSNEDAAEKLRLSIIRVSVGPDVKLKNLGDEAYLWIGPHSGSGVVQFRKSNMYIHLVGTSSKLVEDLARSLADLIP